jgi:hypothetical protein
MVSVAPAAGQSVAPTPTSPKPAATPHEIRLEKPASNRPGNSTPSSRDISSAQPVKPPLSIYESCLMLDRALGILRDATDPSLGNRAALSDQIIRDVLRYVERVDRARPTLPYYEWEEISAPKVSQSGWATQVFTLDHPISQATALSLRARHGDVEIKYLAAIDRNKTKWEFNQTIIVPSDQPRPETCFLSLPTNLIEVRLVCRPGNPKAVRRPRLFIEAGICSIPESAKQCNYHLQVARDDLKNMKRDEAIINIRRARVLLKEYQRTRRL